MGRFVGAVVVMLAAAACWFLAPAALGGSTSYLLSDGGMRPDVPRGALVLVRERPHYTTGDVVAYRNEPSGSVSLRRIVESDGERYVVRGDAQAYADGYRPEDDQILGTQWVTVPWVARVLGWLGSPVGRVALPVLLLLLLGWALERRHDAAPVRPVSPPRRP